MAGVSLTQRAATGQARAVQNGARCARPQPFAASRFVTRYAAIESTLRDPHRHARVVVAVQLCACTGLAGVRLPLARCDHRLIWLVLMRTRSKLRSATDRLRLCL